MILYGVGCWIAPPVGSATSPEGRRVGPGKALAEAEKSAGRSESPGSSMVFPRLSLILAR